MTSTQSVTAALYLIGVKTRNKYQVSGLINPTYNIHKRGADVESIARRHRAVLAWIAIPVVREEQLFSAYFGTIAQIQEAGERFSIPMRPEQTVRYECSRGRSTNSIHQYAQNGQTADMNAVEGEFLALSAKR